jgi:hypothetical protein
VSTVPPTVASKTLYMKKTVTTTKAHQAPKGKGVAVSAIARSPEVQAPGKPLLSVSPLSAASRYPAFYSRTGSSPARPDADYEKTPVMMYL